MQVRELRLGGLVLPSNVFMAPLAGYTCYPFRILCRELGAGLCCTEMVSSNALKYKDRATQKLLFTTPQERVKAAQLLGGDPRIMESVARSDFFAPFEVLDINMGCPVPNVFKSGEGSALMGDFKRASAIIKGCKRSGKIVTVKCRVGIREDALVAAEFARMCEDSGADLITIHGRTRNMMYDGPPCYDQIRQAKAAVSIPVIANGGIFSAADADKMMALTGADGVMIARYGLENPFVFSELTHREIGKDKFQILSEQIELTAAHYDETFILAYIKKLASYLVKKQKGTKRLKTRLFRCGNMEELREVTRELFYREAEVEV